MEILKQMEDENVEYDMRKHPYLQKYKQIFQAKLEADLNTGL